jgi:hypothetical protein
MRTVAYLYRKINNKIKRDNFTKGYRTIRRFEIKCTELLNISN